MPRMARQKSYTNVYHVILRGINRQDIFLDDIDKGKFIKELKRTKEEYNYELYSYVLMNNHIHLLINDKEQKLSSIMKSLAISYSIYFNKKYDRCGHLFENRYRSKCVEEESYLLNLQRYIHQNPEKGKISKFTVYKWSSYSEYIKHSIVADTSFVLSFFDNNIEKFISYNSVIYNGTEISELEITSKLSDNEVITIIKNELQIDNIVEIQNYNNKLRDEVIIKISKIDGIKGAQIARILGLNKRTVQRIISNNMRPKNDKMARGKRPQRDKEV